MNLNVAEHLEFQGRSDYNNIELSNDILKNNTLIVTAEVHVNGNQALPSEVLGLIYKPLDTKINHHHNHQQQQQQQQQEELNYVSLLLNSKEQQSLCEYQLSDGNNSSNLTFSASSSHEPQAELAASFLDFESLSEALSLSELEEFIFPSTAASASNVISNFADHVTCDTINTSAAESSESTPAVQASAALPNENQLSTCSWTVWDEIYVIQEYLIEQEKTHDKPTKQFLCDQFSKTFSNNRQLKQHKASHSDKKNFKCPLCGKVYKYERSLALHKKTHTVEEKFLCEFCGETFSSNRQLKQHIASHSLKKNFKCPLCENVYKYKNTLAQHEKTHTTEKKFFCEYCDKRFQTNGELKQHSVSHITDRDYKCSLCGKAFKSKRYLLRHQKKHETEKTYFCDFCQEGFSSSIKLVRHSARHNTENAACSICQEKIPKENLSSHMKDHADGSQIASAQENS